MYVRKVLQEITFIILSTYADKAVGSAHILVSNTIFITPLLFMVDKPSIALLSHLAFVITPYMAAFLILNGAFNVRDHAVSITVISAISAVAGSIYGARIVIQYRYKIYSAIFNTDWLCVIKT